MKIYFSSSFFKFSFCFLFFLLFFSPKIVQADTLVNFQLTILPPEENSPNTKPTESENPPEEKLQPKDPEMLSSWQLKIEKPDSIFEPLDLSFISNLEELATRDLQVRGRSSVYLDT